MSYKDALMHPERVVVIYSCGHRFTYTTPGVADPAGLYRTKAISTPDGLEVIETFPCLECGESYDR